METNLDIAQENEQILRDNAIERMRQQAASTPKLIPKGRCHNPMCDDDLENPDGIFCPGGDCAKEYELWMRNNGDKRRTLKL